MPLKWLFFLCHRAVAFTLAWSLGSTKLLEKATFDSRDLLRQEPNFDYIPYLPRPCTLNKSYDRKLVMYSNMRLMRAVSTCRSISQVYETVHERRARGVIGLRYYFPASTGYLRCRRRATLLYTDRGANTTAVLIMIPQFPQMSHPQTGP